MLICSSETQNEVWQQLEDLKLLLYWINSSEMKLNTTKAFDVIQGPCTPHPPVFIDNHQLQEMGEQKYLGIMFDSKLQWRSQINYINFIFVSAQFALEVSNI